MNTLVIENISKKLSKNIILNNVSMEMESGYVYGLVGENGSGKSMLYRSIAGLMKPDEGRIIYNNKELYKDINIIPMLGLTLENISLYPEFSGRKNLKFLADINKKITEEQIDEAIIKVGLNPEDKRPIRKYSMGMKQRIVIAQAIMEKPDVILFDEPTNGLDRDGVKLFRKIVQEEKERGAIILITSHIQSDIYRLCDCIYTIDRGTIIGKEK